MARYELWSPRVQITDQERFSDCLEKRDSHDYIMILSPDEASQKCLQDAGLEQYATGEQCVIDTSVLAN